MGDEAVPDVDHPVRAVLAQAGRAVAADRVLDARAPAEPRRGARGAGFSAGFSTPPASSARASVLGRLIPGSGSTVTSRSMPASRRSCCVITARLERALRGQGGVLPVAAAAAAGAGVRARRVHPVRGGPQDAHRVGAGELGRDLGHAGKDQLTGQRVPHEHHRQALRPRDAPAALGDVLDGRPRRPGPARYGVHCPPARPAAWGTTPPTAPGRPRPARPPCACGTRSGIRFSSTARVAFSHVRA